MYRQLVVLAFSLFGTSYALADLWDDLASKPVTMLDIAQVRIEQHLSNFAPAYEGAARKAIGSEDPVSIRSVSSFHIGGPNNRAHANIWMHLSSGKPQEKKDMENVCYAVLETAHSLLQSSSLEFFTSVSAKENQIKNLDLRRRIEDAFEVEVIAKDWASENTEVCRSLLIESKPKRKT